MIFSWAQEAVSGGKIVIKVTATSVADVIEALFTAAESMIRDFGSCMNRITGKVGYEFELTVERMRFCLTTLMLVLLVFLVVYLAVVVAEDEGLGDVHGVVPTTGRLARTMWIRSRAFVWGSRESEVRTGRQPVRTATNDVGRTAGELRAAAVQPVLAGMDQGVQAVVAPVTCDQGNQMGGYRRDRSAQATDAADKAATEATVVPYLPCGGARILSLDEQLWLHR